MTELFKIIIGLCAIQGPTSSSAFDIKLAQEKCQKPKIECLVNVSDSLSYKKQVECLTK